MILFHEYKTSCEHLNHPGPIAFTNSVDPDQLASELIYTVCHSVCKFVSTVCIK